MHAASRRRRPSSLADSGRYGGGIALLSSGGGNSSRSFHLSATSLAAEPAAEEPTSTSATVRRRHQRPIYVAATRQHVGKTSVSLALVSHFTKRFGPSNVGYMKAVGQQSLRVWDVSEEADLIEGGGESSGDGGEEQGGRYVTIDRDVKLIRDHFRLNHLRYADMSPILIPRGYTKSYLDGKIDHRGQLADIRRAYLNIVKNTTFSSPDDYNMIGEEGGGSITICEGTGHAGVGSVVGAGNARVAAEIGADVVLVANGGLGKAFDELELNRSLFLVSSSQVFLVQPALPTYGGNV